MSYIQSPLNYTGGKYKLLPQIEPLFPNDIRTLVDMFCGGGNVGINIHCQRIVFNDIDKSVMGILKIFHKHTEEDIEQRIVQVIDKFDLSMASRHGYGYYNCNSSDGLGKYNQDKYLRLRDYVNSIKVRNDDYYLHLYVLIVYAFNNQIRFNSKGAYNLPVGKRDFNIEMQGKLRRFVSKLRSISCDFESSDFELFSPQKMDTRDFVYADPPYLITCATYNEKGGWTEKDEIRLLNYLDSLSECDIRFALSNVLTNKGRTNIILRDWLFSHKSDYRCHHLNFDYSNSNYHALSRNKDCDEILVTNY